MFLEDNQQKNPNETTTEQPAEESSEKPQLSAPSQKTNPVVVVEKPSASEQAKPTQTEQPTVKKGRKTLFERLYKEASESRKRLISGIVLGGILLLFFILMLFSDNLMIAAASSSKALGFVPFVLFIFLVGGTVWINWFITSEICDTYMASPNTKVKRQLFAIILTSILLVTVSYFWASYFWAPTAGLKHDIGKTGQKVALILFVTFGTITLVGSSVLSFFAFYRNGQTTKKSLFGALITVMVIFYFIFFYYSVAARSWALVLMMTTVAFATDIAAYYGGTRFGKHKLAPETSPNKTWEGFAIGVSAGFAVGLFFSIMYSIPVWSNSISDANGSVSNYALQFQIWGWQIKDTEPWLTNTSAFSTDNVNNAWWTAGVLLPIAFALLGSLGDLLFSKFTRIAGVKDFGTAVPGHGGILDRFDSAILVTLVFVGISIFLCLVSHTFISSANPLLSNLGMLAL